MQSSLKITFALLLLIELSCKRSITDPEMNTSQPGRRDYIWTIDTLDMPLNLLADIWGASPDKIWAVGDMGGSDDRLLYYNGKKWNPYSKEIILCTGKSLFGFSANDIWMAGGTDTGGKGAAIWHYNGYMWKENFRYDVGAYITLFDDIWGSSPDDLYACGTHLFPDNKFRGFILHNDGQGWKEVVVADFQSLFVKIRKEREETFLYVLKRSPSLTDSIAFYELKGNKLNEIFSDSELNITWGNFELIDNEVFFLIGRSLYRYKNKNFSRILSIDHPNFGYCFYGRNRNDLFFRMTDGLTHYNGNNIEYVYQDAKNKINMRAFSVLFEKDVVFGIWDHTKGYVQNQVLHGRLTE